MSLLTTAAAALAIVRKPRETAPATPAADAFRKHLARIAIVTKQRAAAVERNDQHGRKAAEFKRIDEHLEGLIKQRDKSGAEVDLRGDQRTWAAAKQDAESHGPLLDIGAFDAELAGLHGQTDQLQHNALIEKLEHFAPVFRAAELDFRRVHAEAFALATAADNLRKNRKNVSGPFAVNGVEGVFGQLFISRPDIAGYPHWPHDSTESKAARDEADQAVDREAEAIIHRMFNEGTAG